jgi:hypothetical protein
MTARFALPSILGALCLATLTTGCGGSAARNTPKPGAVVVDGERPGRPGCLDCVVRACSTGGEVDTILLELDPPAAYDDVTFTLAQFRVTTPAGVTYATSVDPVSVGVPPISLDPKEFPSMSTGIIWGGSVSEVDVKYTDKYGVVDGETWTVMPKTDGCGP